MMDVYVVFLFFFFRKIIDSVIWMLESLLSFTYSKNVLVNIFWKSFNEITKTFKELIELFWLFLLKKLS